MASNETLDCLAPCSFTFAPSDPSHPTPGEISYGWRFTSVMILAVTADIVGFFIFHQLPPKRTQPSSEEKAAARHRMLLAVALVASYAFPLVAVAILLSASYLPWSLTALVDIVSVHARLLACFVLLGLLRRELVPDTSSRASAVSTRSQRKRLRRLHRLDGKIGQGFLFSLTLCASVTVLVDALAPSLNALHYLLPMAIDGLLLLAACDALTPEHASRLLFRSAAAVIASAGMVSSLVHLLFFALHHGMSTTPAGCLCLDLMALDYLMLWCACLVATVASLFLTQLARRLLHKGARTRGPEGEQLQEGGA